MPVALRNVIVAALAVARPLPAAEKVDFTKDVLPILREHCLDCHSGDEPESGLSLDRRVGMLRGGDLGQPAVVPGKPAASFLLDVVAHAEPDYEMPPDADKLPDATIATLRRWIEQGAVWPGQMDEKVVVRTDHWSFQPVRRPDVPDVEGERPIDAFLLRRLRSEGLDLSPEADPRTLIRRASIVLTGLAPTPEEVEAFLKKHAADADAAYEQLVDRLLDSPHFGERWAQHWLDVIRWAETNGSEANLYRKNAWIYRDYVVRSFNEDTPYDRFVKEQIAGDTLGSGEATGFLVAGPHVPAATVGQEPSAIRQARADRMDEIVQTVGASVMGLTLGCARCHNHKFDPVSIADYYSLTAVFQDVEFGGRRPELSDDHPRQRRGQELWRDIARARNELRDGGPWEEDWGGYTVLNFEPVETRSVRVTFLGQAWIDEMEILGPENRGRNLAAAHRGTRATDDPSLSANERTSVANINDGDFGTQRWSGKWNKETKRQPWVRFDFTEPHAIDRLRISGNREYFFETDYLESKPGRGFTNYRVEVLGDDGEWREIVATTRIKKGLEESRERRATLDALNAAIATLSEEGPRTSFVGRFVHPVKTRVLHRGSPENPKAEVGPAGPVVLGGDLGLPNDAPGAERRARFAAWLVRPEHPLTARVMVNRLWHHVFGRGIVTTTADFGAAGAKPTQPELLDWLAAEFVTPTTTGGEPWSTKAMIRAMVMSRAFRQSSVPHDAGLAKDAGAQLLWRFPPRRVEAEVIRDSILRATGNLDTTLGGRGYRIHNVKKTYAQWEVVDNHGPETWRRMIYQERMRRVDDRMFTAFDFPDCGQIRAKRPVSTTPLQALNLMNGPFAVDQSTRLADRAREETSGDRTAVRRCFQLVLGRDPDEGELAASLEVLQESGLPVVCRALFNSNEFAFLP